MNEEVMIPKSYHDKVCEAMARRHQAEMLELTKGRPQGEWIMRHGTINCSVCKRSNWSACFEDTVRSFNYCPNCGARMKGADDERVL